MPKRSRPPRRQTIQSNTYRFFVDGHAFHGREVVVEDSEFAHQIGSVLRLRAGERVLLLDNSGWQYVVALEAIERDRVVGTVERKELAGGEPRTKLTLYVALMRPERFELVLQKGTELGVSAFVPLICERSTVADADALSERKQERWSRIVREAAEQSRRGKVPRLAPTQLFPAACDQAARRGPSLLLWEGTGVLGLRQALAELGQVASEGKRDEADASAEMPPAPGLRAPVAALQLGQNTHPFSLALFSGPEGGFSPGEFETALRYGLRAVTLGPRTLRAETAPLVAASAILYEMGDLE